VVAQVASSRAPGQRFLLSLRVPRATFFRIILDSKQKMLRTKFTSILLSSVYLIQIEVVELALYPNAKPIIFVSLLITCK